MDRQVPGIAALGTVIGALLARHGVHHWLGWRAGWAGVATDGAQEVTIRVREGYHPNTIRVRAGCPVRLVFQREDDEPCLARVYLSEPPLSRRLPSFAATTVTFTPRQVGTHLFTCEEGRFRGHLIVETPRLPSRLSRASRGPLAVSSVQPARLEAQRPKERPITTLEEI